MKFFLLSLITNLLFMSTAAFAQVSVFPYKIENASTDFPVEIAEDYARLLALTLSIQKRVPVTAPRDVALDMQRFSVDPQGVITADMLTLMGKGKYSDYFLLGTLKRIRKSYISESVLYSVKSGDVILRNRSRSADLIDLARQDIKQIFLQFPDRVTDTAQDTLTDITIVVDISYAVLQDWTSLKQGILRLCDTISDNWNNNVRIYLVPCSKEYKLKKQFQGLRSHSSLENYLQNQKPKGACSGRDIARGLSSAVTSVPWRSGARKYIFMALNSPFKSDQFIERYIIAAKKRRISVFTMGMGNLDWQASSEFRQIAVIGRGEHFNVTYFKRLYDIHGAPIDLLLEAGRLFRSKGYGKMWMGGVLKNTGRGSARYVAEIDPSVEEIHFDEKKLQIKPATIEKAFVKITGTSVIRSEKIRNNTGSLMERIGGRLVDKSGGRVAAVSQGKVLISDGRVSLWIRVLHKKDLDFFIQAAARGYYVPLGVSVKKKKDTPYGITFRQDRIITNITSDYIPDMLLTSLKKIIKNPEQYTDRGLLHPPLWFIKVKVDRVVPRKGARDIRE